jgi:hypothetical protein
MKITENKEQLIQSVIEKRKISLPPIIIDKVVFKEVLKTRPDRQMLYDKMRENLGTMGSHYKNNTFKKYFLYPENPIIGIPETSAFNDVVNVMHFALTETLMERLVIIRKEHKDIALKLRKIEKYLPQYEQTISETELTGSEA